MAVVVTISNVPSSIAAANILPKFETIGVTQLPEENVPGFNRTFRFNNHSDLFALFQLYEEDLGTIRIWDTDTGKLKKKTIITDYNDAADGSSGYLDLIFSTDQKALVISGMVGSPLLSWRFEETDKVEKSCQGYMGDWVKDISDPYYTSETSDNEFSLCQFGVEGELVNYKSWMPDDWWGENTQTLYDGKILTLYDYHIASEESQSHQPKEKPHMRQLKQLSI